MAARKRSSVHVQKGDLSRLSIMFTVAAFCLFIFGVSTTAKSALWAACGILGIVFLAAAFTAHYVHDTRKQGY